MSSAMEENSEKQGSWVDSTSAFELDDNLDITDQKNRPEDTPINTQSINAWHPILDPNWVIVTYLILAAITIPFGTCIAKTANL